MTGSRHSHRYFLSTAMIPVTTGGAAGLSRRHQGDAWDLEFVSAWRRVCLFSYNMTNMTNMLPRHHCFPSQDSRIMSWNPAESRRLDRLRPIPRGPRMSNLGRNISRASVPPSKVQDIFGSQNLLGPQNRGPPGKGINLFGHKPPRLGSDGIWLDQSLY